MSRSIDARPRAFWFVVALLFCSHVTPPAFVGAQTEITDPRDGEVPLPAKHGWHARLVYETPDDGIWTVRSHQIFERFGCPELVALDDAGRCTVLVSYSGKWTPWQTVHDGQWLGAVARVAFDPAFPEPQLYAGGERGRLYQIAPRAGGGFDTRIVVDLPGEEIHTIVGGDLVPSRPGNELLVFTRSGVVFDIRRNGREFSAKEIHRMPGRVRGALVLPRVGDAAPWIVGVSRARQVALIRHDGDALTTHVIHEANMGFGRIARDPRRPLSVYVTRDDGVLLRLDATASIESPWSSEIIYAGRQGLRGVVAGRFHRDADVESVAVFGYGRHVQLLTKRPDDTTWTVETIFTDRGPGHDLICAELDGRNATLEIVGSGYGGRVFLLARPPGYGLDVATDPNPPAEPTAEEAPETEGPVLRIPVAAAVSPIRKLNTLEYGGGFETKSFVYEPLVRRDRRGELVPGLAASWRYEDEGRALILRLAEGRVFHDGSPVNAEAVCAHFRRWVGAPAHSWLGAARRIKRIKAVDAKTVRLEMDRRYDVVPELAATNPCGIVGPGAYGPDGSFLWPSGTGPFRFIGASDDNRTFRYSRVDGSGGIAVTRCGNPLPFDPVAVLKAGKIDMIVDAWLTRVPRSAIQVLADEPDFVVDTVCGSSVKFIGFHLERCPLALRQRIAAALDRRELIERVEGGYAEPSHRWMGPRVEGWPDAEPIEPSPSQILTGELRVLFDPKYPDDRALAQAVAAQLSQRALPAVALAPDRRTYAQIIASGEYELRIDRTWGVPYDPFVTLACRYGPEDPEATSRAPAREVLPALSRLVGEMTIAQSRVRRRLSYRAIQRLLDREFPIVPLYVARRVSVVRRGVASVEMDHDLYRYRIHFGR